MSNRPNANVYELMQLPEHGDILFHAMQALSRIIRCTTPDVRESTCIFIERPKFRLDGISQLIKFLFSYCAIACRKQSVCSTLPIPFRNCSMLMLNSAVPGVLSAMERMRKICFGHLFMIYYGNRMSAGFPKPREAKIQML